MKFTVNMTCDTAAFKPEPSSEIARILRNIATQIEGHGGTSGQWLTIHDVNGNDIGRYKLG